MKTFSAIFIITFFSVAAFAQAGELDSTFDSDGIVSTAIGAGNDGARSMAIQSDGKIIAAGYSSDGVYEYYFTLARYNSDGTLDNSFGNGGEVITAIGSSNDHAYALAIQPDGKIIAAGFSFNGTDKDIAVARYNSDGTPDNSFSNDGKVTTAIGTDQDVAFAVTLQPDGKIIVAGYSWNGNEAEDFALVRYNSDGSLDNSFSADGKVTTAVGSYGDAAWSVALQPDAKIVAAGISFNGSDPDFAIVRYNADGTLDNSFGTAGIVTTAIGSWNDDAYSMALQPDGKIVVAGDSWNGTDYDFALARYNTDGVLDTSFNTDGKVITDIGTYDDFAYSLALQPDGKMVVAGSAITTGYNDFALVRYNTNGSPDINFSTDGMVTTDISSNNDEALSVALQPDGKIVAAGQSYNVLDYDFALARYLNELALGDISFTSSPASILIYPNPIHQTETLEYTLTTNESLTIALYDVSGKLIKNFISNEQRTAGEHKEILNIGALSSGNYFLTLSNGLQKMTVKMVQQ
ncbi:MAG TPA: T9SS type A sorting domain-containing protein [Chitinophagales bacterium]|nr:T9SS type A sorting domain-containing protein [Chitinophagales bacterium]